MWQPTAETKVFLHGFLWGVIITDVAWGTILLWIWRRRRRPRTARTRATDTPP